MSLQVERRLGCLAGALTGWRCRLMRCALRGWLGEARRAVGAREDALRGRLAAKEAGFARGPFVRAWFRAERARRAAQRVTLARGSLLGCAFRSWEALLAGRARQEMLEWLFGPDTLDFLCNDGPARAAAGVRERVGHAAAELKKQV